MKHLLKMSDLTPGEVTHILDVADQLKAQQKAGGTPPLLAGKSVALMFSKNSTRTRNSFEVGVYQLGGLGHYMNAATELQQSGRGEPLKDTARVLGRYYDCVVWRTYRQCDLEEFAELAGVPVINGLTDYAHPCQVLADLMTIREKKGRLEGQKLCFVGDGNNMANSLIVGGLMAGMQVSAVCPEGCEPSRTVLEYAKAYGDKFTLSTDPKRLLIGDDEHGWDDNGVFNFEGGCYAKVINLDKDSEPDIYNAIKRNALLENVMVKPDGSLDFNDVSKTQNGRVAYPIYHIPNYKKDSMAGHPKAIIFLTCDAYGVLPPISKLTTEQAMYHFLCGYTAKVAGTERGIKEPVPNFSPCFGGAFMPLNPVVYAKLLGEKLNRHGTRVYLLNTGWTGGGYGVGKRMDIPVTRACIDGILNGSIEKAPLRHNDRFNLEVPTHVEGVDDSLLWPRNTWKDKEEYDRVALKLAGKFVEHFKQFQVPGLPDYSPYGPTVN